MSYLELDHYRAEVDRLQRSRYMNSPYLVSVETLAVCNARCDFCPYPSLERKGAAMSDELLWKILKECRDLPRDLPVVFVPTRVNEPFLDKRIFDVCTWINQELPHFSFTLFSNASPLTRSNLGRLAMVRNVNVLVLSVNDHRPDVYERVMGLPFARTKERLAEIHRMKQEGSIYFDIVVSKVSDHSSQDQDFERWAHENFPLFKVWVTPRANWNGAVNTPVSPVPDVGCTQWFALEILSNGREAFCCMDADGKLGTANAGSMHILDIYNQARRRELRIEGARRTGLWPCNACPLQA
jgi:hypothetical protein